MKAQIAAADADGHITEPGDLWENYIIPKYRGTCPKITFQADGNAVFRIDDRITVEDRVRPRKPSIATINNFGARTGDVPLDQSFPEGERGGYDPHARIAWMDREGFDATILYPTLALGLSHVIVDVERQEAVANAYNRWLADFCKPYPERLLGAALVPTLSMESALREMENAKKMGFNAIVMKPNPVLNHPLHDPYFYPIWERCQDLDMGVAIHGLATPGNLGMDRFDSQATSLAADMATTKTKCHSFSVEHCFVHTAEMMAAATSLILAGVCDKFPMLRVAFVESGAAWMPGYVDRMDRHFDDVGMNDTDLKTRPSEIFRRQCFIAFEPVEKSIALLADSFGPEKLMVASDYPHGDGFPNAVQAVKGMKLAPDTKDKLLSAGFKQWYGLH